MQEVYNVIEVSVYGFENENPSASSQAHIIKHNKLINLKCHRDTIAAGTVSR
jgi:hypothetical protein